MLTAMLLLENGLAVEAATMNITAVFSPSMDKPENNTFKNTTPQSGYCAKWPQHCQKGEVSIGIPFIIRPAKPTPKNNAPRDGVYLKMPSTFRYVNVTNSAGDSATVKFRVSGFSAKAFYPNSTTKTRDDWKGRGYVYAPRPCRTSGMAFRNKQWYAFLWHYGPGDHACYKISTIPRSGELIFRENSIGYALLSPNPLEMGSGIYKGKLSLRVGAGGDFDFGDNYQANDNVLDIHFTLSVNHELKLTTLVEDRLVTLQPCAVGQICTEEQGKANWEQWMITGISPQLTGRSRFSLSSSGAFTVYLHCERQSGSDCALKSDNTSQRVPVKTLLTLPDNIVDNKTGSVVSRRQLVIGKDVSRNVFKTKLFEHNKKGRLDFLVRQRDVDTMLGTRPDTYRGAVTVIFDPEMY